ncbi:sigma-54-dependent Fis family transcriptional regulator [Sphingomonas sp. MA1305]|uniref:sigma-54-dependent transcriptional regulator n=1 Tax=Sphingomonas sp. MA1305 TaxID=2479204 RepID=UPI0018DF2017|nr:sigma-54-dependent Fis family transcriptional regulator [Sphingomonas sp. MA1305]
MTEAPLRVALVEDDEDLRASIAQTLRLAGFAVDAFAAAPPALAQLDADYPGILVTDVRMPLISGIELFATLRDRDATLPVILITGHGDVAMAVDALKAGAWDFLTKPFDPDRLIASVTRALQTRTLALENRRLRAAAEADADGGLIGESPAIRRLRAMIPALAAADIDLLIEGETGTGKDMLARLIHNGGKRRRRRCMTVACAALPDALIDGDLFASVGEGSVVAADGGTLLLDDIDRAPRRLQDRLAQLIATRSVPGRGRDPIAIDLRVIATAREEAQRGPEAIDPALLYRLAAVRLRLPPLRERREDVPLLFAHLAAQAAARLRAPLPVLTDATRGHLIHHDWPGNVRELAHFADRLVLGLDPLGDGITAPAATLPLPARVDAFERAATIEALAATDGEVGAAITRLGIPRKTFYYRVQRLGIDLAVLKRRRAGDSNPLR